MLFNSFAFVYFFVAIYASYVLLRKGAQNKLLLVASYYFYGSWDWRFLLLIWFSSSLDYVVARALHATSDERSRRLLASFSVVVNLGILFTFKYFGFFSESLQQLLQGAGIQVSWTTLHIVLPVGISFYTFQTMSYTLDVYRRQMEPAGSYLDYLLFVSFFPQLVAGPIERASHLLGQVERPRTITMTGWGEGCWLILLGYYKKVVLADNLAPFANEIFNAPGEAHGLQVIAGLLAFALQIYGDFSGYSDIARGVARLMGFDLMVNFRMPYFAVNPSDFWRRWHISLSTWLRDYLYIFLGGNRYGKAKTYRNLLLTMLLGGLWHGAAWHFVAWGVYHGGLLVIFKIMGWERQVRSPMDHVAKALAFFPLTLLGWLLFRANSLGDAGILAHNVLNWNWGGKTALLTVACYAFPLFMLELFQEKSGNLLVVKSWHPFVRLLVYSYLVVTIVLSGVVGQHAFIYFQF